MKLNPLSSNQETNPQQPDSGEFNFHGITRRQFLTVLSVSLGGIAAALVSVPIIGFLFSPLLNKPKEVWRPVGKAEDFRVGTTSEVSFQDPSPMPWAGVTSRTAAWLRRDSQDQFTAFSVNCTHLGCPVRWLPSATLFMCPCHGGVYDQSG
ncbi:MAG: Rieske 2Fe-2S domain-containing protein, partial [Anaerolineales bacterium]